MAVHLAERLGGAEYTHLEGIEAWAPDEPVPAPVTDPAPTPAAPVEEPTAWLQQLPPLNLPAELGHTAPEWGVPTGPSSLLDLPAPAVTAPAPAPAPASPPAPAAASPSSAAPTTTAAASPAVDATWLAARETALQALRDDYTTAHQQALALHQDLAQSPDTQAFDAIRFGEQFLSDAVANGNAAWETLADLYQTDPATLVSRHSELLRLALSDHALNAGPPPPGRVMGSVQQLGITDLVLADPLMREIAQTFGQTPDAPRTALAWEQVRLYGEVRYEQMTRLHIGMEAVRDRYSAAMIQAADAADGPGWVDVTRPAGPGDEGATTTERRFDPDAFTRWYNAQDGLANRAFAQLYGNSHTEYQAPLRERGNEPAAAGPGAVSRIRFDNAPWHMDGLGAPMRRDGLIGLDLNTAPRMNNDAAVGFDFEVGWATAPENIFDKPSTTQQVVQLAVVVAVGYFTWNPVNAWALTSTSAGGLGLGVTGAAALAGAAAAAAGSFASGAMNGDVDFKNIVRSAFSAALTAGLTQGLGGLEVVSSGGRVGQTLVNMTVQGGVQRLMGGEFKDGATAAFASGLAQAVSGYLSTEFARSLPADQQGAANTFSRVVGSAIRALGNPDDPLGAFASSFLNDVLQDSGLANPATAWVGTGSGTRSAAAAATQQARELAEALIGQGYEPDAAASEAMRRIAATQATSAGTTGTPSTAGPGQPTASAAAGSGNVQTVVIQGTPLARDALGNRYQQGPDGQTTVYLAQGGMLMLGSAQAASIADGIAVPSWTTLRQLGELAVRAPQVLVAGALAGMPGNVGQGPQIWYLNTQERLQWGPGDLWATKFTLTPGGDWQPVLTVQTRPDGSQTLAHERYWVEPQGAGYFGLSEEEVRLAQQPMTTPALQPQGPTTNPLPVWTDRGEVLPPFVAAEPTPDVPGQQAAPQPTWADLIIENGNRENSRTQAYERYRANPSLQDPATLEGRQGTNGVGTWGYPPTPRTPNGGTDYQEQLHGVPYGLELNVGGQTNAQGHISGGAWMDGSELRGEQVWLIERKDWSKGFVDYMESSGKLAEEIVDEAGRQLGGAAGTGARIEWQFSNEYAATVAREIIANTQSLRGRIDVVVVPKAGEGG
jgi:hypothetical protein